MIRAEDRPPVDVRFRILLALYVVLIVGVGLYIGHSRRGGTGDAGPGKDGTTTTKAAQEAMVDDAPITNVELYHALVMDDGPKVLHELIEQRLVFAEAARQKLTLTDQASASRLNDLAKRYNNNARILSVMEPQFRCRLLLRKIILKDVPESRIRHLYDVFHVILTEYAIDGIVLSNPGDAGAARAALQKGEPLEHVVSRYPGETVILPAVRYDEIRDSLGAEAADGIAGLKPGKVVGPVATSHGLAVLRVARVLTDYWDLKPYIEDVVTEGLRAGALYRLAGQADLRMPWWDGALSRSSDDVYASSVFAPATVKQGNRKNSIFTAPSPVPTHEKPGDDVFAPPSATSTDHTGGVFAPPSAAPSGTDSSVFAPPTTPKK